MISIEVSYLPPLQRITLKRRERILIEEGTPLLGLINQLKLTYGKEFGEKVFSEENKLNPYIALLVNGQGIPAEDLEITLKEGDSIILGILLAGG